MNSRTFQHYLPYPDGCQDEFKCLNLLIVRPSKAAIERYNISPDTAAKLPVLVYIHDEGFADGTATDPACGTAPPLTQLRVLPLELQQSC